MKSLLDIVGCGYYFMYDSLMSEYLLAVIGLCPCLFLEWSRTAHYRLPARADRVHSVQYYHFSFQ